MTRPENSIAEDIAIINGCADWLGATLQVRRREPMHRLEGKPNRGVIRNFDLTSVFVGHGKMEHFASVEDLAQTWSVIKATALR